VTNIHIVDVPDMSGKKLKKWLKRERLRLLGDNGAVAVDKYASDESIFSMVRALASLWDGEHLRDCDLPWPVVEAFFQEGNKLLDGPRGDELLLAPHLGRVGFVQ